MLRTMLFLVGILAILSIAPAASAGFTMTVTPPDGEPAPVRGGGSGSVSFTVAMAFTGNMVCAEAADLIVTVTPDGVDPGVFDASVDPATLTFNIGAGAYLEAAEMQWDDSKSVTLSYSIGEIPLGHGPTHLYGVTATYDGTAPELCQPESEFGRASDSASVNVPIILPEPEDDDGVNGVNGTGGDGNDETNESPFFSPLVVVFGIVLYAAARRRTV